jgi:hypothetical protein
LYQRVQDSTTTIAWGTGAVRVALPRPHKQLARSKVVVAVVVLAEAHHVVVEVFVFVGVVAARGASTATAARCATSDATNSRLYQRVRDSTTTIAWGTFAVRVALPRPHKQLARSKVVVAYQRVRDSTTTIAWGTFAVRVAPPPAQTARAEQGRRRRRCRCRSRRRSPRAATHPRAAMHPFVVARAWAHLASPRRAASQELPARQTPPVCPATAGHPSLASRQVRRWLHSMTVEEK